MTKEEQEQHNRVKCFLCNKWVLKRHTREMPFYGKVEDICISCYNGMKRSDDGKEMEMIAATELERVEHGTNENSTAEPAGELLGIFGETPNDPRTNKAKPKE